MNIRSYLTKKRIIIGVIAIVVIAIVGLVIKKKNSAPTNILTDTVKKQDLKQTVLATGQVTSTTDLDLSFKSSGVVNRVYVKVGDKVRNGQLLANLEQRSEAAALTSARGSLAAAKANYDRVLAGASNEEVALAQTTLDNAKKALSDTVKQQETLVNNARSNLFNSTFAAVPASSNVSTLTVSGSYSGSDMGTYYVSVYLSGAGYQYSVSGLEKYTGSITPGIPVPLGNKGLYLTFSSSVAANDSWKIEIPNSQASTYNANLSAYKAALETQSVAVSSAQAAVNTAEAQLNLKKAQARPADIAAAQAQILSAEGQLQSASSAFENTIIRAPADGTITSVDVKVGELATALKEALVLQDVGSLHVEANISEANIANLKIGQKATMTLDSLGPDKTFEGLVVAIDPASTVVSGVVNYKVTASLDKVDAIKPGMTANMTILTAEKPAVLAVASRSVVSKDNKKFIRVIKDSKKKTYDEVEVTTGLEADGGLVEILSGLSEGQEIVTFINK